MRVVDDFAPVSNFQEIKRENEIVGPSNISAICLWAKHEQCAQSI